MQTDGGRQRGGEGQKNNEAFLDSNDIKKIDWLGIDVGVDEA